MDKEQILTLAEKYKLAHKFPEGWVAFEGTSDNLVAFINAAIESYKAELLKEAGEPVYFEWRHCDTSNDPNGIWSEWKKVEPRNAYVNTVEDSVAEFDAYIAQGYKYELRKLYTSDQLAAAIINATKQLEDQLAAAQEENERLENQVLARDAELWGRTQEILGLKDQLAKAEQRVAEACAAYVQDDLDGFEDGDCIAEALRSGEWRKFMKGG